MELKPAHLQSDQYSEINFFVKIDCQDKKAIEFKEEGPLEEDIKHLQIISIKQCTNDKHLKKKAICDCIRKNKATNSNFYIVIKK